jgi:hypothetical protein
MHAHSRIGRVTSGIALCRYDVARHGRVARSTSVSACDLSRPLTAGLVRGRRQATSIESMTLSEGEHQGERAPSR